jgi:hypothetical protein
MIKAAPKEARSVITRSSILFWEDDPVRFDDMTGGGRFLLPGFFFTRTNYGPVNVITWWPKGCKEPIPLVTKIESPEEVCMIYAKRFRIETFFPDHKIQGFRNHKSHISMPERLAHLLIPDCLAYQ